jgi:rhodanese-related sulfurtransferase/glyoxylase-like metal-dependent hydrolase (beta-lactamase superfamily II)
LRRRAERGWRIRHVLETHVHNDYLSGALETRAATEAEIVAPARGGYEFEHPPRGRGRQHRGRRAQAHRLGDAGAHARASRVGRVRPGARRRTNGRFTGGSLLVGSVGRTDLLGPALTDALTRDQQRSLQRLAELPASTQVLPTHGAGSFCSAGPAGTQRTTTIAAEEFANPGLRLADAEPDAFRTEALAGLGRVPAYYAHMAAINRRGPRVLGRLILPEALDPARSRPRQRPASPSSTRATGRPTPPVTSAARSTSSWPSAFSGYVGWLVPFGVPVLLVLPDAPDALAEATTELLRIGYERVHGWLEGGIDAWAASGRSVASYPTTTMRELGAERAAGEGEGILLDVRQPIEWRDEGVVPGSRQIFVADLPDRVGELPLGRADHVFCRSGHRASIAASILENAGHEVRLVSQGGAAAWPAPLEPIGSSR